ncbi:ATP-binding cassette domain-containing protein [Sporichthya polymorpha]|uniref:ATP-binding cassette domain-containing protein n=1 Tax=Sporichthya polymorpha TaxID=35751 RepID=UPI00037627C6|nr:ATP-binding cassette domain-containing protein [Sporichthya polymorpha]
MSTHKSDAPSGVWARLPQGPTTVGVGAVLALLVATQVAPDTVPLGVVFLGALIGTGTGLLAVGLVLTYRSHRVVNFALAGIGGFGASVAIGLHLGKGVPWPIAIIPGIAVGLLCGALVERVVMRSLDKSPRLVVTVATIGLAQLFAAGQAATPALMDGPVLVGSFKTPLSEYTWDVDPLLISGNDFALVFVVPFVLAALTWFLLRTDAGIAIRGIAENGDRARLLGIPANRLSLLVWTIAGGLAALTVTLRSPSEGLNLSIASSGPQVMLPALAAAVVAGLSSLPRAFVAGVALGILDQLVRWNSDKQSVTSVVLLIVLCAALLLRRGDKGRAEAAAAEGTWLTTGSVRGLPHRVKVLPEIRIAQLVLGIACIAALVGLAWVGSPSQLNIATVASCYAVVAVSLVVLTGWAGTVSLGQIAILGTGGVVAGDLMAKWNVDFFVAMIAGGAAGAAVALLVAIPALRVSGQLLAVTTLTFAVAVDQFFFNPTNFPWLVPGAFDRPVLFQRWDMREDRTLYLVGLALVLFSVVVARNLARARTRRTMVATRDNPRSAAAAGVDGVRSKLTAFVICGVLAGMAGAVHATALGAVGLRTYNTSLSLLAFTTVVIGGVASIGGALAATVALHLLIYWVPQLQLVATGVGVLVVLLLLPGGLAQAGTTIRDRYAMWAAKRHGVEWDHDDAFSQAAAAPEVDVETDPAAAAALAVAEAEAAAEQEAAERAHARSGADATLAGADVALGCRGIEASYGPNQVLFGVDLDVSRGEVVALLGTNGAGKSTVLRALCGLLPPTHGTAALEGSSIDKLAPEKIAARGLAMMPGGRGIFPTLTVAENLRLATWMVRRDAEAVADARRRALALFPPLARRIDTRAGDLSGGEQQMLSMAMAMAVRPKVLCIDELSLGLSPVVVGELVDVVREINASGVTVLVVEQSVNVALLLAERAVFLEKGRVRFAGPTAELLDRPDILRAVFLGAAAEGAAAPPPPATSAKARATATDPADVTEESVPALEAKGLYKSFGGVRVINGVDLVVPKGRIVGLIGHNGAGKTTIFDLLSGFLVPDAGAVYLSGHDVTELPPYQRALGGLGRSFQDARLYPGLTVSETIAVALDRHLASRDPLAVALWLPAAFDVHDAVQVRVEELLETLGLTRYRDHLTGELSTGTRRIVELACVLAQRPDVVLLDEPSAGVAQREAEALVPVLKRVQADLDCAMVVVEHDMALMSNLCDELVALETGAVIATGTPAEVLAHPDVISSYLGTDEAFLARSGSR